MGVGWEVATRSSGQGGIKRERERLPGDSESLQGPRGWSIRRTFGTTERCVGIKREEVRETMRDQKPY